MAQQTDASQTEGYSEDEFFAVAAEKSKQAVAEQQKDLDGLSQKRVEAAIQRAGIPKRFSSKTFASYRATDASQVKAMEICRRYAEEFNVVVENGVNMVLTGKPGTGKTHLAIAILHEVLSGGMTGVFVSVSEMLRAIRATYSPSSEMREDQAFDTFIKPHLLILDEVGVSIGDEGKRKAMVFDVINARYNAMRPTILVGNLNLKEMENYLGQRVWDRMQEGGAPVVAFTWDSYRQYKAEK